MTQDWLITPGKARRQIERYLGAASVVLLASWQAGAQQCDRPLPDRWCQKVEFENRTEGVLRQPVSGGGLTVVSFTASVEPYPLDTAVSLHVAFYLPDGRTPTVRAAEKEPLSFYGMFSKSKEWKRGAWQRFGPWDSRTFLIKRDTQVPPSNLALIVDLDSEKPYRLAPAILHTTNLPSAITRYEIVLRPGLTLSEYNYVVEHILPNERRKLADLTSRLVRPGGQIFSIDLDSSQFPDGEIFIKIIGSVRNQDLKAAAELTFEHRARLPSDAFKK